jgi:hypothetical protein
MTVPKLTVKLEHEDELRVYIEADSKQDYDALVWLASREEFRLFLGVLARLYELAKDGSGV